MEFEVSLGKPLVLLIEDDEDIRSSLQDLLLDEGYAVQIAHDGTEALEVLRADFEPECIVLDLMMPQMNGFAFLDILRADPKLSRFEVIICSAVASENSSAGLPHFRKPFLVEELVAGIEAARARYRAKTGLQPTAQ